jgi:ferredoxin
MTITNLAGYPTPNMQSFIAGADLRTYQYHFVKWYTDINSVTIVSSATADDAQGILMNAPNTGEAAEVACEGGGACLICDNTVTNGAKIKSLATGHGTLASAHGDKYFAIALPMGSTTATGDIIPVMVVGTQYISKQAANVAVLGLTSELTTVTSNGTAFIDALRAEAQARILALEVKVDAVIGALTTATVMAAT